MITPVWFSASVKKTSLDDFFTDLHAAGGVAQPGVRPHLDGSVALLLSQLQHPRVIRYRLVEVPLRVVGAAQVAVRPRLLTLVLQSLPKIIIGASLGIITAVKSLHVEIVFYVCPVLKDQMWVTLVYHQENTKRKSQFQHKARKTLHAHRWALAIAAFCANNTNNMLKSETQEI